MVIRCPWCTSLLLYGMGLYHEEMKGFLPLKSMFTFLFFFKKWSAVTALLPRSPVYGLHCCDHLWEGRRSAVVSGFCINTNELALSPALPLEMRKLAGAQAWGHTAGVQTQICLTPRFTVSSWCLFLCMMGKLFWVFRAHIQNFEGNIDYLIFVYICIFW